MSKLTILSKVCTHGCIGGLIWVCSTLSNAVPGYPDYVFFASYEQCTSSTYETCFETAEEAGAAGCAELGYGFAYTVPTVEDELYQPMSQHRVYCIPPEFGQPYETFGTNVNSWCPAGSVMHASALLCQPLKCRYGYTLDLSDNTCKAYCEASALFDSDREVCNDPPIEHSCKTQSDHPIDFVKGLKYLSYDIFDMSESLGLGVTFYYNSHRGQEPSLTGSVSVTLNEDNVAATQAAIPAEYFENSYPVQGLPSHSVEAILSSQFAHVHQYWRHNYDAFLQVRVSDFIYQSSKSEHIRFNGFGPSSVYPHLVLEGTVAGEPIPNGFKLINRKTATTRWFDAEGKMRRIDYSGGRFQALIYDVSGRLDRVQNEKGQYLEFVYESKEVNSLYSVNPNSNDYITSIESSFGRSVDLIWEKSHKGLTATFHLLTEVVHKENNVPVSSRRYEYSDSRWPTTVTDVIEIDTQSGESQLVATFTYDNFGRATVSELSDGFEKVDVQYIDESTRLVENALGKKALFTFEDVNGILRLSKVKGESSANCVESNVDYSYDASGNMIRKIKDGVTTQFQYNDKNQKIFESKAFGTPNQFDIKTCYSSLFDKPIKIIEPNRVTSFEYFPNGLLKAKQIRPNSNANESCAVM